MIITYHSKLITLTKIWMSLQNMDEGASFDPGGDAILIGFGVSVAICCN
jgi:hypothetical protein